MRPLRAFIRLASWLFVAVISGPLRADVALPPFFSDHMVLQRDGRAAIWGTADAGEKVTVRFRNQTRQATADAQGKWRVELSDLKAGGPDELLVAGKNAIRLIDVLVGDVWVGSGQSNMAGRVGGYAKHDPMLAQMGAATHPQIRGCEVTGGWKTSTAENNAAFSAMLFAMAVRLNAELDVPIGMILGAVGASPSGCWLSPESLAADESCRKQMADYAEEYPALLKQYEQDAAEWNAAAAKLKAAGKPTGRMNFLAPYPPGTVNGQPIGQLYARYIQPFVGYGIRGVLWDQGEARTQVGGVDQYTMMGALIRGWRKEWNVGEFPFLYVQKPSGNGCAWEPASPPVNKPAPVAKSAAPAPSLPPVIQPFTPLPAGVPSTKDGLYVEDYVKMMRYPKVGMVISTDLGPGIHPIIKSGYGSRAATVALAVAYDKPVEYYGPIYDSHTIEGDAVRVKFTHIGQGLTTRHSDELQGFAVAGDDQVFHWADAKIDGETVVVMSPNVRKPTAVRYAWGPINNRTWANLFNKNGLPAVTFRTDSW